MRATGSGPPCSTRTARIIRPTDAGGSAATATRPDSETCTLGGRGALLIAGLMVGAGIGAATFPSTRATATITHQLTTTTVSTVQPQDILEVCYTPGGNCASRIIYWIGRANSSVHILIYSFTLNTIGDALLSVRSNKTNLDIKIVWNENNANGTGSEYQRLKNAGLQVRIDHRS